MKKLIALGAALVVLLFSFVGTTEFAAVENSGVMLAMDDKPLPPHPFD